MTWEKRIMVGSRVRNVSITRIREGKIGFSKGREKGIFCV